MATPKIVITTAASDCYHARETCELFQAGRATARTQGWTDADVQHMPLGEALVRRRPCSHCLR
ncbi:hypothetical protein ABIA32_003075 [Streptacidiphilus sp. MAP12-20]|uniref:hypothetical protein n=1 Tax=Streptacidiphilus sp. MAP12-20 TaxID=3156299 RepID=UPI0035125936